MFQDQIKEQLEHLENHINQTEKQQNALNQVIAQRDRDYLQGMQQTKDISERIQGLERRLDKNVDAMKNK